VLAEAQRIIYDAALMRTLLAIILASVPAQGLAGEVPDFCFLQVSDTHIEPHPIGAPDASPKDRSVETIAWFCGEAKQAQRLDPFNITTPVPAFAINTGDLTEFGVIGKTFDDFERYFQPLGIPLYVAVGNHDNTWNGIMQIMRRKYGGDHYSFDKFGCHFAAIDSATPQEPTPSLEQRTLTWLREDLRNVPAGAPIFLYCHHPLSTHEYADPYEQLRFLETIRGRNVVLLLMGHGHQPVHEKWGTLDSVMGGSTFGPHTGYSIISVIGGTLRVVYRFREAGKPMKTLLEKPIAMPEKPIAMPECADIVMPSPFVVSEPEMPISLVIKGDISGAPVADIDGLKEHSVSLKREKDLYFGSLSMQGLLAGAHYLRITVHSGSNKLDRATSFIYSPPDAAVREKRAALDAGVKAEPLLMGNNLIVGTTAGQVIRVSFSWATAKTDTLFTSGGEILHGPALFENTLYFSSGDMNVYSISVAGKLNWKCPLAAGVYGTPAVGPDAVYVGDMEGFVHAIDRRNGKIKWSQRIAPYSIEQSLLLDEGPLARARGSEEGVLYFGAWDGQVYAVNARDGSVKWKERSPGGQSEAKYTSRYYAAADCSPLIVGDHLIVCDRSYHVGSYSLDGKYIGQIAANVSGIGLSRDGKSFYARGFEAGLTRYDAAGKPMWSNPVPLGRFPIPPTEMAGKVYVCSNRGLLTAHDAADGKFLWQYQVTPQLHVMASVAADAAGNAYVAAMDGTVTRVGQGR